MELALKIWKWPKSRLLVYMIWWERHSPWYGDKYGRKWKHLVSHNKIFFIAYPGAIFQNNKAKHKYKSV